MAERYREEFSQAGDFRASVIAVDFCFIKTSGIVPGVTADEEATCLVLLDVDMKYMKAVPAAGKTVTDYLVEGVKSLWNMLPWEASAGPDVCDGESTHSIGVKAC